MVKKNFKFILKNKFFKVTLHYIFLPLFSLFVFYFSYKHKN